MSPTLRGADIVARSLKRLGCRRVFTLSGNHIMSIFDAALDANLDLVHVRHEAAAVHMADAHGRLTGDLPATAQPNGFARQHLECAERGRAPGVASGVIARARRQPGAEIGLAQHTRQRRRQILATLARQQSASILCDRIEMAGDARRHRRSTACRGLGERHPPALTCRCAGDQPGRSVEVDELLISQVTR